MAFTINTNIAGLQAQDYLRATTELQAKTINRVTSGLRILSAGDDAAGLAIANGYRSDQAVLTQGIRNANDGLSSLQTIDGGMSNISKLLDRARTLATQSASGSFSGVRTVVDGEFQSVLTEIDRQAQSIGLNSNGAFARTLSVFLGGGRASAGVDSITNGSASVNLAASTVDSLSLGLKGVQAANTGYDLSTGTTNVTAIATDTTNSSAANLATPGFTTFRFTGAGFGDSKGVTISVNTAGLNSTDALVTAVNTAIANAAGGTTAQAARFKEAGIQAKVVSTTSGTTTTQQLGFTSSNSAFQVTGGDRMANALLGNYSSNQTGSVIANTTTFAAGANTAFGVTTAVKLRFEGAGLTSPYDLSVDVSSATAAVAATTIQTAIANDATLKAAGITMTGTTVTSGLVFSSARGEKVNVTTTGDTLNRLGLGAFGYDGFGGTAVDYNTATVQDTPLNTQNTKFSFSFNGGTSIDVNVAWTTANIATAALSQSAINAAINGVAALKESGLTATVSGVGPTVITFTAQAGTKFRLQVSGDNAAADFGGLGALAGFTAPTQGNAVFKAYTGQGGYQIGATGTAAPLGFTAINFASDTQAITVSGVDGAGATHSQAVSLTNLNARSIDEAMGTINTALQNSNDSTLQKITAIKVNNGGVENIQFVSMLNNFQVAIGKNASGSGINQTNTLVSSTQVGSGANAMIDTQLGAQGAVTALANAVAALGSAQAVVGKGQNQFNYAVALASTQVTNLAASESRIRDADLASEAANLTKAQILMQAGIAALAQANSAPQAVLSLLKG